MLAVRQIGLYRDAHLDLLDERSFHELFLSEHARRLREETRSVSSHVVSACHRTLKHRSRSMRPAFNALCRWYMVSSMALSSATRLISLVRQEPSVGDRKPPHNKSVLVVDNARRTH